MVVNSKEKKENFEFQSEVKQLLHILVYSLYKHKEVFLRELISNAIDALNKIQFAALTESDMDDKSLDLRIDISFVKSQQKLVIEDSGIGMNHEELIKNIGTIAHSGTAEFLKTLSEKDEVDKSDFVGKFGVGFYSSFMVAKEVHIITKSYKKGSLAYLWKSKGGNQFSIEETVKKQHGTRIELFLKKDEVEFLEKSNIQSILSRYSRFIPFPIYIEKVKMEGVEAIWSQPKSNLKPKDYIDFYKFFDNSQDEPETYLHLSSDAPVQFRAVLFIPPKRLEIFGMIKMESGVDLYSRKVLIQKECKEIVPDYLRFIKGIIDSEDIPLNISRETFQNNIIIDKIKKHVIKKIIEHLGQLKDNEKEKYLRIWHQFGRFLKEGVISDYDNKEKIAGLLLFHSSKQTKDKLINLNEYIQNMASEQKEIFYVLGTSADSIEMNPALEAFKKKGWEVLYLTEPLDEFVIDHLFSYSGKSFKMIESADIKIDRQEVQDDDITKKKAESLVIFLKTLYGDKVADVKVSKRLVESPCILVQPAGQPSSQMEKIIKMTHKEYKFSKRVFEVNCDHQLIKQMIHLYGEKPDSEILKKIAWQLLDNMLLREGMVEEIDGMIVRLNEIMLTAIEGK